MIRTALPLRSSSPAAQNTLTNYSMPLSERANSGKNDAARASRSPICIDNEKDPHEPSSLPLNMLPTKISIEKINISAAESTKETDDPFMPRIGKASDLKEAIDFKSLGDPITTNCSNPVYIKDGWVYKVFLLAAAAKSVNYGDSTEEITNKESKHYKFTALNAHPKIEAEAEWMQKYYDLNVDTKNKILNENYFQITSMKDYEHLQKTQGKETVTQRKCIVLIMPQIRGASIPSIIENNPELAEQMLQNIGKLDHITTKLKEKNINHNDLRAQNILFDAERQCFNLIDFDKSGKRFSFTSDTLETLETTKNMIREAADQYKKLFNKENSLNKNLAPTTPSEKEITQERRQAREKAERSSCANNMLPHPVAQTTSNNLASKSAVNAHQLSFQPQKSFYEQNHQSQKYVDNQSRNPTGSNASKSALESTAFGTSNLLTSPYNNQKMINSRHKNIPLSLHQRTHVGTSSIQNKNTPSSIKLNTSLKKLTSAPKFSINSQRPLLAIADKKY